MTNPFYETTTHPRNLAVRNTLGWASVGVALTELLAPKKIERMMGVSNGQNTGVLRILGIRELMHGLDLLAHHDPKPGVFARVAGDALDGVVLGMFGAQARKKGGFLSICAAVLPIVLLDMLFAKQLASSD
jgi:hypothetical protein